MLTRNSSRASVESFATKRREANRFANQEVRCWARKERRNDAIRTALRQGNAPQTRKQLESGRSRHWWSFSPSPLVSKCPQKNCTVVDRRMMDVIDFSAQQHQLISAGFCRTLSCAIAGCGDQPADRLAISPLLSRCPQHEQLNLSSDRGGATVAVLRRGAARCSLDIERWYGSRRVRA